MPYVIAEPCVDLLDRACVEVCPVDCIYQGDRMSYIHPVECIDCGACASACPVDAIYHTADLPDRWDAFRAGTEELFAEVGSPGGAADHGPLGADVPAVRDLPPRSD